MAKQSTMQPDQVILLGEVLSVALVYPRVDGCPKVIEVELVDVRKADKIRVQYDFARDGYSILQSAKPPVDDDGNDQDPGWREVYFVKDWALCTSK